MRRPLVPLPVLAVALLLAATLAPPGASADTPPPRSILLGGHVLREDGTFARADVLVQGGRILAVGTGLDAKDAVPVDCEGRKLLPGLVDARSALLVRSSDRGAGKASLRVADAVDPWDPLAEEAVAHGVTTVLAPPSPASTWGGRPAVVKLTRPARVLKVDAGVLVTVGVTRGRVVPTGLTIQGEWGNVVGFLGRAKAAAGARKKYRGDLAGYRKAIEAWKKKAAEAKAKGEDAPKEPKEPKPPRPDPDARALGPVVAGKAPLRVEVHGEANLRHALSAARRVGVRLVLVGASGAAAVAGEIPETVPVVLGVRSWGGPPQAKPDAADAIALAKAGVPIAIASFGPTGRRSRFLLDLAAMAVREGLPREAALRAITSDAAKAAGLEGRVGRIAAGHDADIVCLDGDPFATSTRTVWVLVEGELVHGSQL